MSTGRLLKEDWIDKFVNVRIYSAKEAGVTLYTEKWIIAGGRSNMLKNNVKAKSRVYN